VKRKEHYPSPVYVFRKSLPRALSRTRYGIDTGRDLGSFYYVISEYSLNLFCHYTPPRPQQKLVSFSTIPAEAGIQVDQPDAT
jgi:hypothetical protein